MLSEDDIDDLNDPDLVYVSVTKDQLIRAQANIGSCASCNPNAEIPFDWLIADVVEQREYVDYILPEPARCPRCRADVQEKTLIERTGGVDVLDTVIV